MKARPLSAAAAWAGVEVIEAGGGAAVLAMTARDEMANRAEAVHGGFIALLADTTMARAMGAAAEARRPGATFDLKLNFVAPGRIGERLVGTARVIHAGRRTGVAECRIEGADGRLVATASATFLIRADEPGAAVPPDPAG